jgi:hypothetical protein
VSSKAFEKSGVQQPLKKTGLPSGAFTEGAKSEKPYNQKK